MMIIDWRGKEIELNFFLSSLTKNAEKWVKLPVTVAFVIHYPNQMIVKKLFRSVGFVSEFTKFRIIE